MTRMILSFVIFTLSFIGLNACEACGCSLSGNGIGLLSVFGQNTISLRLASNSFLGNVEYGDPYQDHFYTLELTGRYQFSKRWSASIFLPYRLNERTAPDIDPLKVNGIGDPRLLLNYSILNNKLVGPNQKIRWEARLGMSFPFGQYDPDLLDRDLPENFNAGRGSYAYLLQSGLIYSIGKWGLNLETGAQFFGKTKENYQFGNEYSTALLGFRNIEITDNFKITPYLGAYAEYIETNQHANGNAAHGTGGEGVFLNGGIQFQSKAWTLSGSIQKPIIENYSDLEVTANSRINIQLNYLF